MGGEIECRIAFVDRFVFVQVDDVFDERFVKVVFYFVDDQIKPVFERGNYGNIKALNDGIIFYENHLIDF